jgi:3-methylcrotonyl-CoA carboxylase alpha subunit
MDERQATRSQAPSPWSDTGGWRLNQPALRKMEFRSGERTFSVDAVMHPGYAVVTVAGRTHRISLGPSDADRLQLALDEETYFAHAVRLAGHLSVVTPKGRYELDLVDPFHYEPADALPDARLTALMPGRVVKVSVKAGDPVKKGQVLMILEAMKMEHTIVSPRDGVVERVAFAENALVPSDAVLVSFREA